jgi:hypothetical protein
VASTRDDHGLEPIPRGQRAAVVLRTRDTRQAYTELTANGVPGIKPLHEWLGRLLIAWVADPDGNQVQIVQHLRSTTHSSGRRSRPMSGLLRDLSTEALLRGAGSVPTSDGLRFDQSANLLCRRPESFHHIDEPLH